MIPILFESTETEFDNNGLGRLRDCISCMVTEERNGIYECDFEYPVTGSHFDDIILGRIIGVEHDYTNDVQPFDIVSYSRPINGVVTFHAVHISYRLRKSVTSGKGISSLAGAFTEFNSAIPSLGFTFNTDITGSNYISAFDGVPKSVRSIMGGVEGSILDAYSGEYAFDKFNVTLYRQRGINRNLTIRYGLNMTDFNEDADYSDSYNACIGYWIGSDASGNDVVVKTGLVQSGYQGYNNRTEVVALDLSDKFEDRPTVAQLATEAQNYMSNNQTYLPSQTITVDFINLRDTLEYQHLSQLYECNLCDTVKVVFPRYGIETRFKVVKTVYDVLLERYQEMELGQLSMSLSEALGIEVSANDASGTLSTGYVNTDTLTISANDTSGTLALDVTKSGYTAIGLAGWWIYNPSSGGANSSFQIMHKLYLSGANTVTYELRNTASTRAVVVLRVYVLYRKN